MTNQQPILELTDVHTYYGNIHALKGISCAIPQGQIACLIGANGAGKSTTLMTIFGVERATRGEIRFQGDKIQHLRPEQVAARGVSQAPEGRQIFPKMSCQENLEMGAFLRKDKDEVANDMERVFELFPVLKDRVHQLGGTLSGGEQQMLAMGRALMSNPKLLLLDEPSLGLSPIMCLEIAKIIRDIHNEGNTIVLVEQNARLALALAQKGYVLETGNIVLKGDAKELRDNEKVKNAYLGG